MLTKRCCSCHIHNNSVPQKPPMSADFLVTITYKGVVCPGAITERTALKSVLLKRFDGHDTDTMRAIVDHIAADEEWSQSKCDAFWNFVLELIRRNEVDLTETFLSTRSDDDAVLEEVCRWVERWNERARKRTGKCCTTCGWRAHHRCTGSGLRFCDKECQTIYWRAERASAEWRAENASA